MPAGVGTVEPFEYLSCLVGRDADAGIGHLKCDDVIRAGGRDADLPVLGREFHGVVEEIADELLDVDAVCQKPEVVVGHVDLKGLALGVCDKPIDLDGMRDLVGDVDGFAVGAAEPRGERGDFGVCRNGGKEVVAGLADVCEDDVTVGFAFQRGFRMVPDVRERRLDVVEEVVAEFADLGLATALLVKEPVEGEGQVAELGYPPIA